MAVKAPYRLDEQAGATNTMEVTSSSGALHRILFWKTTTRATEAAYIFGGGYRAFGTITIDHANTPSAKEIESCFH